MEENMNKEIDDGGPAFPQPLTFDANGNPVTAGMYFAKTSGMSLRDWFAGKALQGRAHRLSNPYNDRDILASDCYEIADAMIAARKGGAE